jgi:hypothetical protein
VALREKRSLARAAARWLLGTEVRGNIFGYLWPDVTFLTIIIAVPLFLVYGFSLSTFRSPVSNCIVGSPKRVLFSSRGFDCMHGHCELRLIMSKVFGLSLSTLEFPVSNCIVGSPKRVLFSSGGLACKQGHCERRVLMIVVTM